MRRILQALVEIVPFVSLIHGMPSIDELELTKYADQGSESIAAVSEYLSSDEDFDAWSVTEVLCGGKIRTDGMTEIRRSMAVPIFSGALGSWHTIQ